MQNTEIIRFLNIYIEKIIIIIHSDKFLIFCFIMIEYVEKEENIIFGNAYYLFIFLLLNADKSNLRKLQIIFFEMIYYLKESIFSINS